MKFMRKKPKVHLFAQRRIGWKRVKKNNSYFLKLEQRNQTSNTIQKLTQNGNTVYGTNAVLSNICNFYESLYQSSNVDDKDIGDNIENAGIPTLDDDSRNMFDTFPTIKECADAV